ERLAIEVRAVETAEVAEEPPPLVREDLGVLPAAQVVPQDNPIGGGAAECVPRPVLKRVNITEPVIPPDDEECTRSVGHIQGEPVSRYLHDRTADTRPASRPADQPRTVQSSPRQHPTAQTTQTTFGARSTTRSPEAVGGTSTPWCGEAPSGLPSRRARALHIAAPQQIRRAIASGTTAGGAFAPANSSRSPGIARTATSTAKLLFSRCMTIGTHSERDIE